MKTRSIVVTRAALLVAWVVALAACVSPAGLARAEGNFVRVPKYKSVVLPTQRLVDLSREGAVEFWYVQQNDPRQRAEWADFLDDAYSVVLSFGNGKEMTSAIVIGAGGATKDQPAASIGVISDLSVLSDKQKTRRAVRTLFKTDGAGAVTLDQGTVYHFLLVKRADRNEVEVFLNGLSQGLLPGTFGNTVGLPVVLGCDLPVPPDPTLDASDPAAVAAADAVAKGPKVFPFEGQIGGLRIWRSGALVGGDAHRLNQFERPVDPADLAMIPGYGDLAAYGDFTDDDRPRLRPADPLAGAWYPSSAVITQTKDDASVFDDYPIYTFVPATTIAMPPDRADRVYNVFEDANYIGTLKWAGAAVGKAGQESWTFRHADEWQPMAVTHEPVASKPVTWSTQTVRDWRLSFARGAIPNGKKFAFAETGTGTVELRRRNVAELRIKNLYSTVSEEEREARAQKADMSLAFLVDKYPRFYDTLYSGFNVVTMKPWDLFGDKTKQVLRKPTGDQCVLDLSIPMIVPFDLTAVPKEMKYESSGSRLISNASEYNAAMTGRIGGGVSFSGSATAGIGIISATVTNNTHVIVQTESMNEMAKQDFTKNELLVREMWTQEHGLIHKKELLRLSDDYANDLRALYANVAFASDADRRSKVYEFFDKWGTHYPLAVIFGSQQLSETKIDEAMRSESATAKTSFKIDINGGDSGRETIGKEGTTKNVAESRTQAREFGDKASPVPIALDLRPIHDLITPAQFPGEPHLYTDLRYLLAGLFNDYMAGKVSASLTRSGVPEQTQRLLMTEVQQGPPPNPIAFDLLRVRFLGVRMDEWKMVVGNQEIPFPVASLLDHKLDGKIAFWPSVTASSKLEPTIDLQKSPEFEAFIRQSPQPMVIFDSNTEGEQREQTRTLRPGQPAKAFGEVKNREMTVRIPAAARQGDPRFGKPQLRDFFFVQVASSFWNAPNADWKMRGSSVSVENMLEVEAVRTVQPLVLTGNPPILFPFDTLFGTDLLAGSVVWATANPAELKLSRDLDAGYGARVDRKKTPRITLRKDRMDPTGEAYVFHEPSSEKGWRKATATVFVKIWGKNANPDKDQPFGTTKVHVEYEYALLPDFKNAIDANRELLLPQKTWGDFTAGAKQAVVDPLANRSTRVIRPAPSARLAESVFDTLKLSPDGPYSTHSMAVKGFAMHSAGLGTVAFTKTTPLNAWTFVERQPGEWMILSTIDSLALTATDAGVVGTTPRDGDPSQFWLVGVLNAASGTYTFTNKQRSTYLGRPVRNEPAAAILGKALDVNSTVFEVTPPVDLSPDAQLGRLVGKDDAEQLKLLTDLESTLALPFADLGATDAATAVALTTADYMVTFDLNRDGKIERSEAPLDDGPFPVTQESFAARMGAQIQASLDKIRDQQDDKRRAQKLSSWVASYRPDRGAAVVKRVIRAFDANRDGLLDATEGKPVFDLLSAKGTPIGTVDGNHDGKADEPELLTAVTTASTRAPKP